MTDKYKHEETAKANGALPALFENQHVPVARFQATKILTSKLLR